MTANVAPALMHRMCAAAIAGDLATARAAHFRLLERNERCAEFTERNDNGAPRHG